MTVTPLSFSVRDWFAWKPGQESRASWMPSDSSWQAPAGDADWATRLPDKLPMMLRRRMSGFGQKIVESALLLPAAKQARYVFASRHGEFATTLRILEALHLDELPSAADFSLSVHHALAGILSIQAGNKQGHTTVSCGRDTFAYGLLEAVATALEEPGSSTLLVAYDEPLPAPYEDFRDIDEDDLPLIVVLEISAGRSDAADLELAMQPAAGKCQEKAIKAAPLGADFVDFLLSNRAETQLFGDTMTWNLRRVTNH